MADIEADIAEAVLALKTDEAEFQKEKEAEWKVRAKDQRERIAVLTQTALAQGVSKRAILRALGSPTNTYLIDRTLHYLPAEYRDRIKITALAPGLREVTLKNYVIGARVLDGDYTFRQDEEDGYWLPTEVNEEYQAIEDELFFGEEETELREAWNAA